MKQFVLVRKCLGKKKSVQHLFCVLLECPKFPAHQKKRKRKKLGKKCEMIER